MPIYLAQCFEGLKRITCQAGYTDNLEVDCLQTVAGLPIEEAALTYLENIAVYDWQTAEKFTWNNEGHKNWTRLYEMSSAHTIIA